MEAIDDCADKDECLDWHHGCHEMATCTNTRGSFTCECNEGWKGDGRHCADDNQCYNGETGCDINAEVRFKSEIT